MHEEKDAQRRSSDARGLTRHEVLKCGVMLAVGGLAAWLGGFGCAFAPPHGRTEGGGNGLDGKPKSPRRALEVELKKTEECLQTHPRARKRLTPYLEEVRKRLQSDCSDIWVAYQSDRLRRIRWLLDKDDDGTGSGMRLRMRPYDIPWLVWVIDFVEKDRSYADIAYNGVVENMEKILTAPEVEIVFTDKYADFCCLCSHLTPDGCSLHPEFGDYGKVFPQPVQMSPTLKASSDLVLKILGLSWNNVVTGRGLLDRCAEKAPEPSAFPVFPELGEKDWPHYRSGIGKWRVIRDSGAVEKVH